MLFGKRAANEKQLLKKKTRAFVVKMNCSSSKEVKSSSLAV